MKTLAQRQVELLLDLDRAADAAQDETTFALEVVGLLANTLSVDFAALALPDEEPSPASPWRLQAVIDRQQMLGGVPGSQLLALASQLVAGAGTVLQRAELPGDGSLPEVQLLASALQIDGELLGIILLARAENEFTPDDIALLDAANSRLDSALRHLNVLRALERETQVLRTIHRIDRIRDTSSTLDELLDRALSEVCRVLPAEVAFVMLYDRQGNRLEMRAITDAHLLQLSEPLQRLYRLADHAIETGALVQWRDPDSPLREVLGVPLLLESRIIGVLGILRPRERETFRKHDGQLLSAIASQMDTAIFERLETQRLREAFGRNVGKKVMERLLQVIDRDLLKGDRVEITALFSDIRGFTESSQDIDPAVMQEMVNIHLDAMVAVILRHEGTLDKFLGDGIMAFFNAPERQPDHALRAVRAALAMQDAHQQVMKTWQARGVPVAPIGIGVATGEAIVGNFGSVAHSEYSVIGTDVNLAARLCGIAEGGQTLISRATRHLLPEAVAVEALPPQQLKGFLQPVPVWQVMRV